MFFFLERVTVGSEDLTSKSVQRLTLSFEGIHHVHGSNGLTTGVLGVGYRVTNDVLEEYLKNTTSLLVDESGDTFDTTTTCETTNSGFRNTLDVIT